MPEKVKKLKKSPPTYDLSTKSQGSEGRGSKTSGPWPLSPWDLGYLGPKAQSPDVWPGFL